MENETKNVAQLNDEITKLDAEIGQVETELHEAEAAGDTSAKALDQHGRLASKIAMLHSRKAGLESAILPAKRTEAAAKVEELKAEHHAALEHHSKVVAGCRAQIAPWYAYGGGEMFIRQALSGALPVKEAHNKVVELQNQLMGALRHLQDLPK